MVRRSRLWRFLPTRWGSSVTTPFRSWPTNHRRASSTRTFDGSSQFPPSGRSRPNSLWDKPLTRSEVLPELSERRVQRDVTELNWTELTWFSLWRTGQWAGANALQCAPSNGVGDYVTTRTYASTNDQYRLALLARWLVGHKLNRVNSVQSRRYVPASRLKVPSTEPTARGSGLTGNCNVERAGFMTSLSSRSKSLQDQNIWVISELIRVLGRRDKVSSLSVLCIE